MDRIQDINGNFVRGVPYNVDTERDRQRIDDRNRQIFRGNIEQLLQNLDVQSSQQCTNNVGAQWNFETNVNQVTQLDAVSIFDNFFIMCVNFIKTVCKYLYPNGANKAPYDTQK